MISNPPMIPAIVHHVFLVMSLVFILLSTCYGGGGVLHRNIDSEVMFSLHGVFRIRNQIKVHAKCSGGCADYFCLMFPET